MFNYSTIFIAFWCIGCVTKSFFMYRITKVDIGWIVERLEFKYNFLGLHFWQVWRPYVKTSGIDECWGHSEKKYAIMNLKDQIEKDTYGIW